MAHQYRPASVWCRISRSSGRLRAPPRGSEQRCLFKVCLSQGYSILTAGCLGLGAGPAAWPPVPARLPGLRLFFFSRQEPPRKRNIFFLMADFFDINHYFDYIEQGLRLRGDRALDGAWFYLIFMARISGKGSPIPGQSRTSDLRFF